MALDMFLDIEGEIAGEARDAEHRDEIDVLAWVWGMSHSGSFHERANGAGSASFEEICITKYIDKSSPILMLYCSNGNHFPSAKLTVRKDGKNPLEYLVIEMKKVLVTSVSTGGSDGEDRLTEQITLNFEKHRVTYTPWSPAGFPETPVTYAWNIPENKEA